MISTAFFCFLTSIILTMLLTIVSFDFNGLRQWFSNCASRRPGASFQFSKGVAGYFGFVSLNLGFIASKEL